MSAGDERSQRIRLLHFDKRAIRSTIALLEKMDEQYEAEEALGELTPERGLSNKIVIPNLVNKAHYLVWSPR